MPQVENIANSTKDQIGNLNEFLGINIGAHPWNLLMDALKDFSVVAIILAVLIPVPGGSYTVFEREALTGRFSVPDG